MGKQAALAALIAAIEAGDGPLNHALALNTIDQVKWCIDAWNGSLDAATALHDALLPGWMWLVRTANDADIESGRCDKSCNGFANVWGGKDPNMGGACFSVFSIAPARAWLVAILKAYLAQITEARE